MSEKTCYVCLRITPNEIFSYNHKLLEKLYVANPKKAHLVGRQVCELLEEIYKKNRFVFCGRSRKVILSSLFYRVMNSANIRMTQSAISDQLGVTVVSLRNFYKELFNEYPNTTGLSRPKHDWKPQGTVLKADPIYSDWNPFDSRRMMGYGPIRIQVQKCAKCGRIRYEHRWYGWQYSDPIHFQEKVEQWEKLLDNTKSKVK